MNTNEILTYAVPFIGLIGIIVGWALTQWSNLSKVQRENKSNLKLVLFNLLEVHHVINTTDENKFIKIMSENIFKKFLPKEEYSKLSEDVIKQSFGDFIKKSIFPHLNKRLPQIKKDYEESLETIKKIDPILAFKLSGKTEIIDYLDNLSLMMKPLESNEGDRLETKRLLNKLSPNLRRKMLESFEENIKTVAYKINLRTWFKVKNRLSKSEITNIEESEIMEIFGDLFKPQEKKVALGKPIEDDNLNLNTLEKDLQNTQNKDKEI